MDPTFRYQHTGPAPAEFLDLSGELVFVQGRGNAILEPGEKIELPFLVDHVDLQPLDHATTAATAALHDELAGDVMPAESVETEPVKPARRKPNTDAEEH